jgi:PAS domain S-box-containing protein
MNDNGRELFGFAPNEHLPREIFLARVHPEDRKTVNGAIESARTGSQRRFEIEYRLLRPDGETLWLISRGRYLRNNQGQLSEMMGVAMDVTAQVKSNLEPVCNARRWRAKPVSLMGELTASLAHELNQPLAAIASNAAAGNRFLARGALDIVMFEQLLEDVYRDARRAGGIIHGIHQLVRKGEVNRRAVKLNEIIPEVLRLLHSDLLGRSTTVETNLFPDLAAVHADPIHLQQVLLNLIINALDAMQNTPVGNRQILISTCANDGFAEVSVRDHGVGLPQDDPNKIFAGFYSTKPDGMGMGLKIVRSIVEHHGGELGAENLPDGARFYFRLPTT